MSHCGIYRGAAHSRCNIEYRISKSEWKLPVNMYNLKDYDGHLIVKALKGEFVEEVRVIPQNMENYLSITVDRLKFIDSFQFTPQSLDSLVKTLEVDEFKYVRQASPIQHEFELIKRKGVYHYDYMDSFARFDESRLPSQDAFFSKLSDSPCSDTEYAHATQVWNAFECESMADYHENYLCGVLLLADFFQKFRASCLAHYSIGVVHYYTAPGLAWVAAHRMTHVSLELITDVDMYHFVEYSIQGRISMITTRFAQANFHTLPGYDASHLHVHLIYLDANNLYGWAMSQPLPTGGFQFLQPDEIETLAPVGELSDDAVDGYIYEMDLHYPQHLHNAHEDYPLVPESLEIGSDMYSPAQHAVFPQTAPQKKLTPNLRDKVRYVVHYRNLKLYLQLGLVLTRIHRVLAFKQSTWLKTYIYIPQHPSAFIGKEWFWEDTSEFEEACTG